MALRKLRATIILLMGAWPLGAADAKCTIDTAGAGIISVCRNWNFTGQKCRDYDDVKLPSSISEGDAFSVRYGSNPKGYNFRVGRIEIREGTCLIYPPHGADHPRDSISVACPSGCR